jgi:hypothetical protein
MDDSQFVIPRACSRPFAVSINGRAIEDVIALFNAAR